MKLDLLENAKKQLSVLIPYLENIAQSDEHSVVKGLEVVPSTAVLITRCLQGWTGLYTKIDKEGIMLTPKGAFLWYLKLKGELV